MNEYEALKRALTVAGVSSEHLETLVVSQLHESPSDSEAPSPVKPVNGIDKVVDFPEKARWAADAPVFVPKPPSSLQYSHKLKSGEYAATTAPPTPESLDIHKLAASTVRHQSPANMANDWYEDEPEYFEGDCQDRTLMIRGLSPFTTLADLAQNILGGIILNMYIRARDRTAFVSFVEPLAAEKFIMHTHRNDIYLKGKRLEVTWAEKQHHLPGYIQRQVYHNGATRNIVIRFAKQDMTEDTIRDDLEHIYRLEVVDIVKANNHYFISTNGIQWAITARHCMQSRLKYKDTRIEFFEDECDQILPLSEKKVLKQCQETSKRPAAVSMANRFALLLDHEDTPPNEHVKRSISAIEPRVPA